jgi:hypothetical protein
MRYLLIDLRTGLMDGMYCSLELADGMCVKLEQQYVGSVWRIFEMYEDGRYFDGPFPPQHMHQAYVAQVVKEQDEGEGVH